MITFNTKPSLIIENNKGNRGIYGFSGEGATGKSYIYKILKNLRNNGDNSILAITYDRDITKDYIISKIRSFSGEVIFLDRFDMYICEEIQEELYNKRNDSLILLDLKDWNRLNYSISIAGVDMFENRIVVDAYEDSF